MHDPWFLWLPAFSGLGYAISAMAIKRAIAGGMGAWRLNFIANWIMLLLFFPYLWIDGFSPVTVFWPMVLSGVLFFLGQATSCLALEKGDVSVVTPVLGAKVILVALFSAIFLAQAPSLAVWLAAFMTVAGIFLLQSPGRQHGTAHHALPTIAYALFSAASFAAGDIVLQQWAPQIGFGSFILCSLIVTSCCGCLTIPKFRAPLWHIPANLRTFVFLGAGFLALQALGMAIAIGKFGHAAEVNVVYSSRGIWSILLVWLAGSWFANTERHVGIPALLRRLVGSVLILLAILFVVK